VEKRQERAETGERETGESRGSMSYPEYVYVCEFF
jgi:hypothetical protein